MKKTPIELLEATESISQAQLALIRVGYEVNEGPAVDPALVHGLADSVRVLGEQYAKLVGLLVDYNAPETGLEEAMATDVENHLRLKDVMRAQ
jgi:hypothetical protein